MKTIDFPPLEAVRDAFASAEASSLEVFSATGLTPAWQEAFKSGRAKDPSYSRICTLVEWLCQRGWYAIETEEA